MGKLIQVDHWRDVDLADWRWPNFLPAELACNGTGELKAWSETLDLLEFIRGELGGPLIVNSFYRSLKHNSKVGGSPRSQHLLGRAADLRATRWGVYKIKELALKFNVRGIGLYDTFVHVDMRDSVFLKTDQIRATWDNRT